ncbi:TonB-dependent receptor [bacterium]|nr:TonB-dependent receptor [bacterium]
MNRRALLIGAVFLAAANPLAAARLTISGYVTDRSTGETVIGANILIQGKDWGTASDGNGFFALTGLAPGRYTLEFSHIAYDKKEVSVTLTDQSRILSDTALEPKVIETQAVSIIAEKSELADLGLETGHRAINAEAIRRIPAGRNDVFRAIKHLPGIESIDPFSPLYAVRGSDTGENLILLDGVPIFNPYHFVGSSGLFNVYALKAVELMVGGFGAEYGGRNSSVLYITTREGNNRKLHGEIAPGTATSNGVVDFPVGRKITMMMSGRWYCDLISYFLLDAPSYFYDMNGTMTWKISNRHQLSLRYFRSLDDLDFRSDSYFNYIRNTFDTDIFDDYDFGFDIRWRNEAVSGILRSVVHPNVYWQTQVYRSSFSAGNRSLLDFEYVDEEDDRTKLFMETVIRAKIRDTGLHSKLDMRLWRGSQLKIGGEWNRYAFQNDIRLNGYSKGELVNRPEVTAAYGEYKIDLGLFSLRPGIRYSNMSTQTRWNREYRLNAAASFSDRIRLKAAWGQYLQYIVSINTQEYEMSQYLDTYFPLASRPPCASRQAILGFEADLSETIRLSLDIYHKDLYRTYAYDYNASQLAAPSFLDKLRQGRGEAYGFELLVKGSLGKTSGWISYGWSRSTRQYPHIMNGRSHLFDYDRPHAFKTVLNHRVNPALEFSGSIGVLSGLPKTEESGYAHYYYYDPLLDVIGSWPQVVTPAKNNIRMPYILQVDFGVKKRLRKGFGAQLARYLGADNAFLNVSVSNVLFALHRNVWFYIRSDETRYGVGTNYFPEVSMGYSIQF